MFSSLSLYPNMSHILPTLKKIKNVNNVSMKINVENLSGIFSFSKNNLQQSKIRAISIARTEHIIKFKAKILSTISIFEEKSTLINLIHSTRLK